MSEQLAIHGGPPVHAGLPIPLFKVVCGQEELAAVQEVFQRGVFCAAYPAATQVRALEEDFARWLGVKHALAFSSGTTAQHAALAAVGVGPGDEVIVPPLTFISTAYTPLLQRAVPIFADVDPGIIILDPADVRRKITPRTRAIVPVHWFGHPAEMDELTSIAREHNLAIIEDCAHANGTRYRGRPAGTFGAAACWSLQESKMITSAGEGGMLTTDDDAVAAAARAMRNHGRSPVQVQGGDAGRLVNAYQVTSLGNNYRMTEIQAAFGRVQLTRQASFRERRRVCAAYLDANLTDVAGLVRQDLREGAELSYAYYPVRFLSGRFSADIEEISHALAAEGVGCYPIAQDELCHIQPLFAGRPDCAPGSLPQAELVARELLLLPLHPALSDDDLTDIVAAVRKVARAYWR
ncbi:MAG: DegT/DnrJ/EryC1/StrS family aminotransferase [Chloroflexi bacterium]|nr:DegT/DnrJ/EryC1/StrS family aminotransferase [Chloroflexota bacterium]